MLMNNDLYDNHGIDDKYCAADIMILKFLFDINYRDTLISRYTIIS